MEVVGVSNILTSKGAEPISLARAKEQLRIDADLTHDDDYIENLIRAARSAAETHLKQPLLTHTISTNYACFSTVLPLLWKSTEITSVDYKDKDGADQTVSSSNYYLSGENQDKVTFISDFELPEDVRLVTVNYTAKPVGVIAPDIKTAMLLTITDLYENRTNPVRRYMTASEAFLNRHRTPTI